MILILCVTIVLLIYYWHYKNCSYWKSRNVPFIKPTFLFGSFYHIITKQKTLHDTFRDIYNKGAVPYIGIHLFTSPTLVVTDPELIKLILVNDFENFSERKLALDESVDPLSYHSIFSAETKIWHHLRSKMSLVFTSGKIKLMFPMMKDLGEDLDNYLNKYTNQILDAKATARRFTLDIVMLCAFGIRSHCLKDNLEVLQVAERLIGFGSLIRSVAVFGFFFWPVIVKILRQPFLDRKASKYFFDMFTQTSNERLKNKVIRNDLVDLLNEIQQNEKFNEFYKLDENKKVAQALTFITAGGDTASSIIAFTLYELALNEDIQDRLRKEIRVASEDGLEYETIQKMEYIDMILSETMRKYPATAYVSRKTVAEYTFKETGLTLEKNTGIAIPLAGIHHDPKYFQDPEKYDPERFRKDNKENIKPFTYMPFGEGPRVCIAQRFGLLMCKIALCYALKNFKFERTDSTPVPLEFNTRTFFLNSKHGVPLRVVKL